MFAILLFIFSPTLVYAVHGIEESPIDITIDSIAVLTGFIGAIYIFIALKSFTGSLKKAFNYITYGIIFQILALAEHTFYDYGIHLIPLGFDAHYILMAIGVIFFAIAAYYLRKMMSELNKKGYR